MNKKDFVGSVNVRSCYDFILVGEYINFHYMCKCGGQPGCFRNRTNEIQSKRRSIFVNVIHYISPKNR